MNKSQRGRRTGSPDTKAQILEVARRRFLAEGYETVTLRSIAAEAEVDAALISYFFGSKKGLFGAVMALVANPAVVLGDALRGGVDGLGARALRALLTTWDDPVKGGPLRALMRATAVDPAVTHLVGEAMGREMVDKVAEKLGGARARQRAAVFVAQMAGVIYSRYLLALEPIASMNADEIVRALAPSLQLALRGTPRRPS